MRPGGHEGHPNRPGGRRSRGRRRRRTWSRRPPQAAAAAHTGAVDHDGVQRRGDGGIRTSGRSWSTNFIMISGPMAKTWSTACRCKLLQRGGDNALLAVGAVVGHDAWSRRGAAELVLQDQEILGAEADDGVHLVPGLEQVLGDREGNGAARRRRRRRRPSLPSAISVARPSGPTKSWTNSPSFRLFSFWWCAHDLENDGDGALFAVVTGDGQGDALAVLNARNDELAGLGLLAQLGEHLPYKQRVIGSSPIGPKTMAFFAFLFCTELPKTPFCRRTEPSDCKNCAFPLAKRPGMRYSIATV